MPLVLIAVVLFILTGIALQIIGAALTFNELLKISKGMESSRAKGLRWILAGFVLEGLAALMIYIFNINVILHSLQG